MLWTTSEVSPIFFKFKDFELNKESSKNFKTVWFESNSSFSRRTFKKTFSHIKKVNSLKDADLIVLKNMQLFEPDESSIRGFYISEKQRPFYLSLTIEQLVGKTIVFDNNILITIENQVFENEEDLLHSLLVYLKSNDKEMRNLGIKLIISNLNPKKNGQFLLNLFSKHVSFSNFSYPKQRIKSIWISEFVKEFPYFKI